MVGPFVLASTSTSPPLALGAGHRHEPTGSPVPGQATRAAQGGSGTTWPAYAYAPASSTATALPHDLSPLAFAVVAPDPKHSGLLLFDDPTRCMFCPRFKIPHQCRDSTAPTDWATRERPPSTSTSTSTPGERGKTHGNGIGKDGMSRARG